MKTRRIKLAVLLLALLPFLHGCKEDPEPIRGMDFLLSASIYDPAADNYKLTTANLRVFTPENILLFNQSVTEGTNIISITEDYENIKLEVEKEGYGIFTYYATTAELESFVSTPFTVHLFPGVNLNEGLLAHYSFNGHTNDVSGNQLHGTAQGGTYVQDKNNQIKQAYSFDGLDDHIWIDNTGLFENQQFSISCWVAVESDTGAILSFSRVPDGLNNSGYYFKYIESKPAGQISLSSNSYTWSRIQSEIKIQQENWEHLVYTYNREHMNLYLNGALIASVPETRNIDYLEHNPIIIGGYATKATGGTWLKGKIDELKIYNKALNSAEIHALSKQ